MPLELSKLPVSFAVPAKFSGEPYSSLINSIDFLGARNKSLIICVDEDKWHLSKPNGDVGLGVAEEHFMDFHFPGFDDGFAAAYQYRKPADLSGKCSPSCHNRDLFIIQTYEMRDFVRRYRDYNSVRLKIDFTFEEAFEEFKDTYFPGWRAGFRTGFCGLSCEAREHCDTGKKYLVSISDFTNSFNSQEQWMQEVHGQPFSLSD